MLHFSPVKTIIIVAILLGGVILALPNLLSPATRAALPSWAPHQTIHLGLDLRGGAHLLLEIDSNLALTDRLDTLLDDIRNTLRGETGKRIGYRNLQRRGDTVTLTIRDAEDFDEARNRINDLSTPTGSGMLSSGGDNREFLIEQNNSGQISMRLSEVAKRERVNSLIEQSMEIVRRRVDELGTTEPTIQRQGFNRILVQVPGLGDPSRLKELLGKTAKMTFHLLDHSVPISTALESGAPPGAEILYGSGDEESIPYLVRKRVMVSGEHLVDSRPSFDQNTNEPIVTFRFDSIGGRQFGRVTQTNVGLPFAIVLDGSVISAPVIREPILGGSGQISGNFTIENADNLAILLRSGALPAPLVIVEERTVGPSLGADSIASGKIAGIIGFAAVIVFIFLSYGLFGLFANIALILNMILIIGALSVLQATLTLPGIAGIILTIGMAVDANVLIYERIREESRAGRPPISAIEAGYKRALATILDANITTFIAAIVLFMVGAGPVRGFAVTLSIGLISSVFTAYTVTLLMVSLWIARTRPKTLPI